jgi:hypothetical protein
VILEASHFQCGTFQAPKWDDSAQDLCGMAGLSKMLCLCFPRISFNRDIPEP